MYTRHVGLHPLMVPLDRTGQKVSFNYADYYRHQDFLAAGRPNGYRDTDSIPFNRRLCYAEEIRKPLTPLRPEGHTSQRSTGPRVPLRSWMVLRPLRRVHPDKTAQPPAQLVPMQLSSSVRTHSKTRGGAPSAEPSILRQSITTGSCFSGRTSCSAPLEHSYSAPDREAFASMSRPPTPARPSQVAADEIKMQPEHVADAAATASASSTQHNTDGSALPAGKQGSLRSKQARQASKQAQLSAIAQWRDCANTMIGDSTAQMQMEGASSYVVPDATDWGIQDDSCRWQALPVAGNVLLGSVEDTVPELASRYRSSYTLAGAANVPVMASIDGVPLRDVIQQTPRGTQLVAQCLASRLFKDLSVRSTWASLELFTGVPSSE